MSIAIHRSIMLACLTSLWTARPAAAGYTVGINFLESPAYFALEGSGPSENSVFPYPLDFSNDFDGAIKKLSTQELQQQVAYAVQNIYRDAALNKPGEMLNARISPTPVDALTGTNIYVASVPGTSVFGVSEVNAANTRPDLDLNLSDNYTNNYFSAAYLNTISALPVTFTTADQVVNAIAGTIAHEIAHTLGVANHDPATSINGQYSVMSSGTEGLPDPARLTQRGFINIQPVGGGPSAVSILLQNIGTTQVTDFNFDNRTDASDGAIYLQHVGETKISVSQGDASNDGRINAFDRSLYLRNLPPPQPVMPVNAEITYDMSSGKLSLVNHSQAIEALALMDLAHFTPLSLQGSDGSEWISYADNSGAYVESRSFAQSSFLGPSTFLLGYLDSPSQLPSEVLALQADGKFSPLTIQIVPEPALAIMFVGGLLVLNRRPTRS